MSVYYNNITQNFRLVYVDVFFNAIIIETQHGKNYFSREEAIDMLASENHIFLGYL